MRAPPEGIMTMQNRVLRLATELGTPVTVRKVPAGLLFWRSADEDVPRVQEVAAQVQSARRPQQSIRRG
jgi:hypothetical protein